ncbi:MAG: hypothetical protein QM757_01625 [Paludibaculum sp.]
MVVGPTQGLELLFLQGPQEFGLEFERQVADLIEEKGAVVGPLKAAFVLREGSGESTAFVAEQLAFEQRAGNGRAVQLDEWTIAAGR